MSPGVRRLLQVLGALALLQGGAVLVYRAVENERSRPVEAPFDAERLPATEAPDIELRRTDGTRFRLSDLRGHTVLLHFWATWCRPCETELPGLIEFAREHQEEQVTLLAVAVDEDWPVVEAFFRGAVPPEIVQGARGDERKRYGVGTLPDTYIVRPSGQLGFRMAGAREWRSAGAREVLHDARRGAP